MKFEIPYEKRGAYDVEWCYDCERMKEDCVCEELSDHFREVEKASPDADVCVPAVSGPPHLPESFEDWLQQNNDSIEIGI